MGAYQIFYIEFKDKESRDFFEKINDVDSNIAKPRRLFQYNCLNDGYTLDCTYYMSWDGYGLGSMCIDAIKKYYQISQINKFLSLDLSTQSDWYDELKNKSSDDEDN